MDKQIQRWKQHELKEKKKPVNHYWTLLQHYLKPLLPFLERTDITEICINRFDDIYIEENGELIKTNARFENEADLKRLIFQIGILLNQPVDDIKHPILDGRLPTGERINAVLFPVSTQGHCLTIRCFPKCSIEISQLLSSGSLTSEMLIYLRKCVKNYANILICGATGSGKTTLLNVLANYFIEPNDRVITIEDTQELQINHPNYISMESPHRSKIATDQQEITMSEMIKNALRQRPTRLIVGEIRTPDAAEAFLTALNTGHKGSLSTIHANNCEDALFRLDSLMASSTHHLPFEFIQQQVRRNIDIVVYQEKTPTGRKVKEIVEVKENWVEKVF